MKIRELNGNFKSHVSGFLRGGLVGLLVLAQFTFIIGISLWLQSYTVYFYVILEVLSFMVVVVLINDNRSSTYKIAWVCIALLFPISGHVMYALWGKSTANKKLSNKIKAKIKRGNQFLVQSNEVRKEICEDYKEIERLANYMVSEGFPIYKNNQISYYPMGEDAFDAIFADIENAKKFVLLDFFIVAEGGLWDELHALLLAKIKEGVEVKFLYDDFGAMIRTSKDFRRNLEEEGFEIRVFNPIHKYTDKLYMNYRSHQKIVVIDGNTGYTGGVNIADEYANLINRFGVWKDTAIRVYGEAVWGLTVAFLQMWEVSSTNDYVDYTLYRPTKSFPINHTFACTITDGPVNNPNNPIENVYKQIIHNANDFLYIYTPYLIIEEDMQLALIMAARSGVDVRIVTPFIPDKKHVKILTNYNYGILLKNGIKIYEYTPGFIHAKSIINENCGVVGTINMDYRSFYLHYECGVFLSERKIISEIKKDYTVTFRECREISYEEWTKRPVSLKIYQSLLNMFATQM